MPRLFFALQPEPAEQAAISAALLPMVRAIGARPLPAADLHLTLAFLGEVAAEALPDLQRVAAEATPKLFHLRLSQVDCWKSSGVLCLLPDESAPTVARKVPPVALRAERWPQLLPVALAFTANGFALMESTRQPEGPRYRVIRSWPPRAGDM